jgi:predicted pyridoxine 5'-phosphate oxidase superfamily flavin-nucleotide-binding protein
MVNIPKEVMDTIAHPESAKMLATVDQNGNPNVVPVWSVTAVDFETVAFAEIFIKNTKTNLETTKKVAIAVFKGPATGYQLKGNFVGFQTSGPIYTEFAKKVKAAMNLDIKSVGIIQINAVYSAAPGQDSKKIA